MTYEERKDFEEKNGRQPNMEEEREFDLSKKKEIRKYANHHLWTDINPYEVVRKISDITVEVRKMEATLKKAPSEFHQGGFVGNYADNNSQEWEYESIPDSEVIRIRWSKSKGGWFSPIGERFVMSDTPQKFYDYNF